MTSRSLKSGLNFGRITGLGSARVAAAAALAATAVIAGNARADGTATVVLNGDKTWNSTGLWTWVGDTGNQVYPGDGVGPGAGTENAIAQSIFGGRTLNISTAATGGYTIGSFTLQQVQANVTRGLNVNYQGTTGDPKFTLNTSLIQHVDAPGVVSSGGGANSLVNSLVFNNRLAINGGNLVLNAATASNFWDSALNFTGNIGLKIDDSDLSFNNLTVRGTKAIEIENNLTGGAPDAVWNMNGAIRLEGTGQFRFRYNSTAPDGLVNGTSGLTQLVAAAPGNGYANAIFERATGTGTNRIAFTDTVLNSNLFYDPNSTHVSLGNVQVNGKRTTFIFDGSNTNVAVNGSDYSNITGDADSEWLITGGSTWTFDKNVQSTMLGKVGAYDYQVNFNANGALGAVGVADKYGMIVLGVVPTATDKFEIRNQGIIRGNSARLAGLDTQVNLTLAPGATVAHETLGANAAATATVANLGTTPNYFFGLGADTPTNSASFDITVGTGTAWRGISSDRGARRWNNGVITANSDFTIQSGRFIAGGASLVLGNGTAAGSLSIANNTGAARVKVDLVGRIDFDDDQSNYSNADFFINNQSEARFYRDGALGSATATVMPGGVLIASSTQNGGSSAFNGNVLIKSGGAIQINSKDINGNLSGLIGTGTITREPNIIVWLNHAEALNGSQFGPSNVQNGDLMRIEANDIKRFEELPGGVTVQVKGGDRTFANGFTLDGGALVTDQSSRSVNASTAGGSNLISVGAKGATFASSTPTLTYIDPRFTPLFYNGSGNVGGSITGTNTLTVNVPVHAIAAGGVVNIGSATPIDGLNMLGAVTFTNDFVVTGNVNKINNADLIFNGANTVIGGDLISGGGAPGLSPNVKFGNNTPTLSDGVISGNVIGGSLIMKSGTKADLNIATPNNNGVALQNDNRLDVNLKIVVEGGMAADGKRIYVDRRDSTAGTVGLINLDKVTIAAGATIGIDEATTDVRIKNPTLLGNFTVDQGSGDGFEFENLNPAAPVTIYTGVVQSTQGVNAADVGLLGTIGSNVTFESVRGRQRLEDGVVFNGTINTQNVPVGGDSWVRVFAGQSGVNGVTGTGQVNLGGTVNGSGGLGNGEDFYVYVNDSNDAAITNTVPLRVNILANQFGTIVSDRSGADLSVAGQAVVNNVHLQAGSTLYLGQNQDTSLTTDLVLEGNATVKKNDGDTTANQVYVRNVSGAANLAIETGSLARALTFNGNATNARVRVGIAGASAVQLNTGASLPAVELGGQGQVSIPSGQSASVASLTSVNAAPTAIDVSGTLQIRPAASAAAATTSKVASLSIAGGDAPTGTLDLGAGNRLAIDYAAGSSPITTVRNQIIAAFNSAWAGPGLTTSAAVGNTGRAVGYAEASELLGATGGLFGSETVDGDTLLVRSTLSGDATLDGSVDFLDLARLAQNYNTQVSTSTESWWVRGDFNYDGSVDFLDLAKLAQNYNTALPTEPIPGASAAFESDLARAFAAVPEPSIAGFAFLAAVGTAATRRRRRNR